MSICPPLKKSHGIHPAGPKSFLSLCKLPLSLYMMALPNQGPGSSPQTHLLWKDIEVELCQWMAPNHLTTYIFLLWLMYTHAWGDRHPFVGPLPPHCLGQAPPWMGWQAPYISSPLDLALGSVRDPLCWTSLPGSSLNGLTGTIYLITLGFVCHYVLGELLSKVFGSLCEVVWVVYAVVVEFKVFNQVQWYTHCNAIVDYLPATFQALVQISVGSFLLAYLVRVSSNGNYYDQQWADISHNGKAKGCYFHFWKLATGC